MTITNAIDVTGSIALVIGAVLFILSRTTKDTIRQQTILISAQKERLDLLELQHVENARKIGEMQGQLQAYKELPLKQIAESLNALAINQESIIKILNKGVKV